MKIILLKDVKGIGRRLEEKEVSDGHAVNFLIPQKLAVPLDSQAGREALTLKTKERIEKMRGETTLESSIRELSGTEIRIKRKANEKNHLFSGITKEVLSEILQIEKGLNISAKHLLLEAPIKELGVHNIGVKLEKKMGHFSLIVEGE